MATAAPETLPPPAPRRRRWPWIVLAGVLVVALAVFAFVAFVFTTPQGARLALGQATRLAGGGVKIEGVEGRIGGLLRIHLIEVSRPDLYARVEDLEMDSAPLAPLHGTLVIHRLAAKSVELRTASTQAAARVPVSFAPPYPFRLEDGRVAELRKGTLTREAAAEKDPVRKRALMDAGRASDVVVRDIALKGEGTRSAWTIEEASATTAFGSGRLAGKLQSAAPFALDVKAAVQGRAAERDYHADLVARGTLKDLQLDLDATVSGQRATGHVALAPFATFPLRGLQVHADGVDLARQAGGPESRLTLDINLAGAAEANAFAGPVRIENALPGRWDAHRLPFMAASARVVVTRERIDVADLNLALLGGGSATGRGSGTKEGIEADLRVADVDLAALQGTLQRTRVTGHIVASGDRAAQRFEVALKDPRFTVEGRGALASNRLTVETARVGTGGGAVTGKGEIALAGAKEFHFEGRADHFDPSAFVKTQRGDLNFAFDTHGRLAPAIAGEAKLDIAPSLYAGQPASGRVHVAGDARRVSTADIDITIADAHVTAHGAFGGPGDALDFTFRAPNLATVAKPFGLVLAGRAEGEGRVSGSFRSPAGRITLRGTDLSLPANVGVRELSLRAEAGADPQSRIDAELHAKGVAYGKETPPPPFAESVDATLEGTRASHRLQLATVMTRETSARVVLHGGLDAQAPALAWSGHVEQLAMTGRGAFTLQAPATLQASASHVELGDAKLAGEWGEAHFITTRWTPRTLDLRGTSPGIVVRNLARSLRLAGMTRSSLVLAADWDVHGAGTLDGTVSLKRVSGDLQVGDPPMPLGLQALALEARVVRGQATVVAQVAGDRVGRLDGRGTALLARGASGWSLAPSAPISAHVVAEHSNLEALSPWLGVDAKLGGRINAVVDVSGTSADPRLAGELRAQDLVAREPQSGFEVENGQVAVRLAGKSITIERFTATTPWHPANAARERLAGEAIPASGTIEAQGGIDLEKRSGTLRVRADHAVVTQTPSRFVAVSGEASLSATGEGMLASGRFTADAGWVGALDTPTPSVSEDVVVVRASKPAAEAPKKDATPLRIDLTVALGKQVFFVGRGLDTRLAGDLHLTGTVGGDLRATGLIRTVGGTYKGYGQNLAVERGVLQFAGPIDNPKLNVLAVRKGLAVEAGVEVLGTATRPKVRLVSTPEVPEAEKLSWLVLGRGPSELAPGDASVLLAAATSMLGGNNPGSDLGKKFGLDEVKIGRADTGNVLGVLPENTVAGRTGTPSAAEVVTVGKRLGHDVSLSYEQGLGAAEGAVRVAWRITRSFQLLVRAGYLPGADAVYRWTFR